MSESSQRGPLLLAVDTATSLASVALFDGEQVLAETTWMAGRGHSARLLVEVDGLLQRVGRQTEDLTGLVVAHGPGSFTGVRVGISVAKGMAAGLEIPLWGIGTLDVLAHAAMPTALPVRPVLDAGRGRVATALFRDGRRETEIEGVAVKALADLVREPTVVVGDLPADIRAELGTSPLIRLASPAASIRRAGYLAELGWRSYAAGVPGDPTLVDAVYLTR